MNTRADIAMHNDWLITLANTVATNLSSVPFTVPDGRNWHVMGARIEYTASGDSGNRQVTMQVRDSGGDIRHEAVAGLVQTASQTIHYEMGIGLANLTAAVDTYHLTTPIGAGWVIEAGGSVVISDRDAIAATADDIDVTLTVMERRV